MANPPKIGTDWLRQQANKAANATPAAPSCDPVHARDSEVELWLQNHGIKYAPKAQIPIGLIDEKSSLNNQARFESLVPDAVERYAESIKKGEYLPPIVCYKSGNRLIVVDGNNRHAAHKKAGSQFIPGFVIDPATPSETITLLTVSANNRHGVVPDEKWRIKQAAQLVGIGFNTDKACAAAGVKKTQLADYTATQRADARAAVMKIQGFTALPSTHRRVLGRVQLDPVFHQAARVAIDTQMTSEEVQKFSRDIKALGTEDEQIAFIAETSKERKLEATRKKATGNRNSIHSPYHSLVSAMGKLMNVDPALVARQVLTDMDRQLLIRRLDEVGLKLIELQTALEARDQEVKRGA